MIISNDRNTQMPTSHSGLSSYDTEITGGSHIRTCTMEMIPQLDGPTSVHSRQRILENARTEHETFKRTAVIPRGEYPGESDSNSHGDRRAHNGQRPSGRRRYQDRSGRPPDRGNSHDRGYSRRGRPPEGNGRPPDGNGGPPYGNGGPLMMEDPLMEEDPLMMEDPLEMDKIEDTLEGKDHQAHQDLLDQ